MKEALNTACLVAQLLEREGSPVLVVEAEARDLSILVTSLALIILDPDTRYPVSEKTQARMIYRVFFFPCHMKKF